MLFWSMYFIHCTDPLEHALWPIKDVGSYPAKSGTNENAKIEFSHELSLLGTLEMLIIIPKMIQDFLAERKGLCVRILADCDAARCGSDLRHHLALFHDERSVR